MGICEGRTVIVTGAGRGLGREYALGFAAEGANVVVNDLGGALSGGGKDHSAADGVADEIRAAGGKAIANYEDVTDWDGAGRLVEAALGEFGGLDVVVNNAGIMRIVPFLEDTLENWDQTTRVHLRGHFCVSRRASDYWKSEHRAGRPVAARIINISSGAGLQGATGQAPYATAKGGIASLTLTLAVELADLGITVNAIAPTARTRMTSEFWPEQTAMPNEGFDFMDPANVAAALVWLGSEQSGHVTGCVFEVGGGMIALEDGWDLGPMIDRQRKWVPAEVGPAVDTLLARRKAPRPVWGS
ncbi:MAG: SDR family oxidoreductase [Novosphingobium sp.]|nr:SDR family oxidoreductase [Novosphingobium sp.]